MELIVQIRQGRIVVTKARTGESEQFAQEAEAVSFVAYKVAQNAAPVRFDESCGRPGLQGRPGFREADFRDAVDHQILKIAASTRSMAA